MEMNLFEEAVNDLDRATGLNPQNAKAHQLLGDVYSRMGEEEKAAIYWQLSEQLKRKKLK
jgi:Flp pilus assembly protein TadD